MNCYNRACGNHTAKSLLMSKRDKIEAAVESNRVCHVVHFGLYTCTDFIRVSEEFLATLSRDLFVGKHS